MPGHYARIIKYDCFHRQIHIQDTQVVNRGIFIKKTCCKLYMMEFSKFKSTCTYLGIEDKAPNHNDQDMPSQVCNILLKYI